MTVVGFRHCAQIFCFAMVLSLHASPVAAFGVKTHVWMANQVLKEIEDNCRLEIAGDRYRLSEEQCLSIRNHPGYFLSGALGPDIYPDMVAGQAIAHPPSAAVWQSGDWLRHLVKKAGSGSALAFATGYVLHAGQNVFANSYVNTFAGGLFSLDSDPEVAARHTAIEKYLDAHLPPGAPDAASLRAPASFLKATLIFDADAVAQYRRSGAAPHIVAMHDVKAAVENMTFDVEALEGIGREFQISYMAVEQSELSLQQLEQELAPQLRQHEAILLHLNTVMMALGDNEKYLAELKEKHAAESEALAASENIYREASVALQELKKEQLELQTRKDRTRKTVTEETCRNVRKWINAREWTSNRVCQQKSSSNKEWSDIQKATERIRRGIDEEEKFIRDALVEKTAASARLDAVAKKLSEAEARGEEYAGQRLVAEMAYQRSMQSLQMGQLAALAARGELGTQAKSLQPLLDEHEKLLQTLQQLLGDLHELSVSMRNWQAAIDRAGDEYVYAGLSASRLLLTDKGGTVTEYREWLACRGDVFLAQPYSPDDKPCVTETPYQHIMAVMQRIESALHAPGLNALNDAYQSVRKSAWAGLQKEVRGADGSLQAFVAAEGGLSRLAGMREDSSYARRRSVQVLLAGAGNAGDISLLTWKNGADIIDADAGIAADTGVWNPDVFRAVQYAGRLSRMTLLSGYELNTMSGRLAGQNFSRWRLFPEDESRYSLLYSSLRDMSGNQQWQPFGLPYARSEGTAEPEDASKRHYGFAAGERPGSGFVIFSHPEARRMVFRRLFPEILSLVESDPRMQAPDYPFPSCPHHPFPVTFTAAVSPAAADTACAMVRP